MTVYLESSEIVFSRFPVIHFIVIELSRAPDELRLVVTRNLVGIRPIWFSKSETVARVNILNRGSSD